MKRLLVATHNKGKLRELAALAREHGALLLSLDDAAFEARPPVAFPEEGGDYRENALAKARAAASQWGVPAIADDSGLEVDALGGAPGPFSARFGGPGLSDAERVEFLLEALRDVESERRSARFVCWMALALPPGTPGGDEALALGECRGAIALAPSGASGFGYDPVFVPAAGQLGDATPTHTMAELAPHQKNRISHRARAFAALAQTSTWGSWLST